MKRKIKFIIQVAEWWDKVNGNTYHSCRITRTSDGKTISCPYRYGSGEHYRHTALNAMADSKWLPVKYRGTEDRGDRSFFHYERENNYPIFWIQNHGTKKEMIALGESK